jgi:hypothetical protein
MAQQLEAAELVLLDQGATAEELERAIGRDGYMRKLMQADIDAQIREVTRWLTAATAHCIEAAERTFRAHGSKLPKVRLCPVDGPLVARWCVNRSG